MAKTTRQPGKGRGGGRGGGGRKPKASPAPSPVASDAVLVFLRHLGDLAFQLGGWMRLIIGQAPMRPEVVEYLTAWFSAGLRGTPPPQ